MYMYTLFQFFGTERTITYIYIYIYTYIYFVGNKYIYITNILEGKKNNY